MKFLRFTDRYTGKPRMVNMALVRTIDQLEATKDQGRHKGWPRGCRLFFVDDIREQTSQDGSSSATIGHAADVAETWEEVLERLAAHGL